MEVPCVNVREIREKGDAIYERLKDKLEAEHWGEIIVIEPESEDYQIVVLTLRGSDGTSLPQSAYRHHTTAGGKR